MSLTSTDGLKTARPEFRDIVTVLLSAYKPASCQHEKGDREAQILSRTATISNHPAGSTWATSYKAAQGLRQLSPRPDCQQSVSDASNSRLADLARTADPIPRNLSHPRSCDVTRRPKCGTQCYHYHGLPRHTQHCP